MGKWSPDEFLARLYEQTVEASLARSRSVEREELRRRLSQALGSLPQQEAAPLEPELLGSRDYGGLRIEELAYTTYAGVRVPAYALYPRDARGPLPAVLACHGHGPGYRAALGMNPDGSIEEGDPGIHNRFAMELARRGMFVLVPEILGFGERRLRAAVEEDPDAAKASSCLPISQLLLMCGTTIAGFRVHEARRALDMLTSRSEVDAGRLGIVGFSGGGLIASMTAALDERVRAAVLCGYTNTYAGSILDRPHCMDNYVPGILQVGEQPDILGLIAPRPLFVESGQEDLVFPLESTEEAIRSLGAVYRGEGAEDRLAWDLFPGKHEISGRQAWDWLLNRLSE